MTDGIGGSRPGSPESQMTNSLYRANSTIDDLTTTLTKISRAPTPDDLTTFRCCCGREECINYHTWASLHKKLEGRLILCAEVGRALLEKHEAYVRRHGGDAGVEEVSRYLYAWTTAADDQQSDNESFMTYSRPDTPTTSNPQNETSHEGLVQELRRKIAALEKRLDAALLNAEVAESSRNTVTQELNDARETVTRLTSNQARSIGWETRLNGAIQEKEDLLQELESERQRAKTADAKLSALQDRSDKQQADINHLHDELEQRRVSRTELSEEILRDARARLQMLQQAQLGHIVVAENPEVERVMESLVADNEALKRDVAELQNLLVESREDSRVLRDEVEELQAHVPSLPEVQKAKILKAESSRVLPSSAVRNHKHTQSWASSFGGGPLSPPWQTENNNSAGPSNSSYPLTPSTLARPLSPEERRQSLPSHPSSVLSPSPRYATSQLPKDPDENSLRIDTPDTIDRKDRRSPRKQLFLLTQNKAIQTDDVNWAVLLHPYARTPGYEETRSGTPPIDGRSDSSSLLDLGSHSSTIAALVERTNTLFGRMSQADVRTLTNRLKRQRLTGDVSHLSHSTVSAILSDVGHLRHHFRAVLEDDRVTSTCTRKDLRSLLALLKEMFGELGHLRVVVNDVVLDPSYAQKISTEALDPMSGKEPNRGRTSLGGQGLGGWVAPITKFFGGSGPTEETQPESTSQKLSAGLGAPPRQRIQKLVPKLGPALAASTTTVNVEFSGGGVGRSVSTAISPRAEIEGSVLRAVTPAPRAESSKAVLGIFAGAPKPAELDPWVVVGPKAERRVRGTPSTTNLKTATLSRAAGRRMSSARLPRNVDAIVDVEPSLQEYDDEEGDGDRGTTLLERTLRPRGLSDSSIHSSFMNDEEGADHTSPLKGLPTRVPLTSGPSGRQGAFPSDVGLTRQSVLRSLSKTIQAFKTSTSTTASVAAPPKLSVSSASPSDVASSPIPRATSPNRTEILPTIASWAAAHAGLDADSAEQFVGSFKDEQASGTLAGRRRWHRDLQGGNF
ncbi:hypothetical protein SCHPADRAFT_917500 [Schizopora paradoxa]|uniref:Uncharacterized protein n=1 Tax=Schizopora paradoxa TaxID=27342 RepID=A0A0H2R432_9AGAM|nr:hypothetical protein SCHPADRAFT_917500 [Schizopora paradoxa]